MTGPTFSTLKILFHDCSLVCRSLKIVDVPWMSVIEQLKGQEEAEHIWKWHSRYQDLMTVGWPSYHDAANRDDPIFSSGISHVWRVKHPSTDAELTPTAEVFQVWRFSHACRVALQSVSYEGRLSGCPRCMGFPEMGVAQNHPFSSIFHGFCSKSPSSYWDSHIYGNPHVRTSPWLPSEWPLLRCCPHVYPSRGTTLPETQRQILDDRPAFFHSDMDQVWGPWILGHSPASMYFVDFCSWYWTQ